MSFLQQASSRRWIIAIMEGLHTYGVQYTHGVHLWMYIACVVRCLTYFSQMNPSFSTNGGPAGSNGSAARSWSPNSFSPLCLTLCLLSHRVGDGRPAPPPPPSTHPPTTSLPPLPDGPTPLSSPSLPLHFYLYIYLFYPGFAGYRF